MFISRSKERRDGLSASGVNSVTGIAFLARIGFTLFPALSLTADGLTAMYVVSLDVARPSAALIPFLSVIERMRTMTGPSVEFTWPPESLYLVSPLTAFTNKIPNGLTEVALTVSEK